MSIPLSSIRIFLVEDHVVMRAGLRLLLESQPGLTVVGEATTYDEALTATASVQPDTIVLDLDLGGESIVEGIPALLAAAPQARVLVLTGLRDPDVHRQAVSLGAMGVVLKDKATEVLLQAIRKVHAGEVWIERTMMAHVLNERNRTRMAPQCAPEAVRIASLTVRERDIIALIGEGLKNRQIAERLNISETTVRHHLTAIFDKLEVTDRLALVVYAYRYSLVTLAC